MEAALPCEIAGEACALSPEGALLWPREATVFVADLHLGKSAAFRAAGVGVPESITVDLARLSNLLEGADAERLVVLGDLFHAPEGQSPHVREGLLAWRRSQPGLEVEVALGNHDRRCGALLEALRFRASRRFVCGPFQCVHDPADVGTGARRDAGGFALCGHLHPAVRIADRTRSFRLPCFWFGEHCGILPAFGSFTGTHAVEREAGDRVFAIADGRVVAL